MATKLKTVRAKAMNWSLLAPRSRRTSLGMTAPAASPTPKIPQTTGILEACAAAFWVLRHVLTNLYKQTLSREVLVKGRRPLQSTGIKLLTRRGTWQFALWKVETNKGSCLNRRGKGPNANTSC